MNERIKELYEQSMKVVSYTDGGYTEIKALDADKFAELIVRECLNTLQNKYAPDDCLPQEAIALCLKEHFGVE